MELHEKDDLYLTGVHARLESLAEDDLYHTTVHLMWNQMNQMNYITPKSVQEEEDE